MRNNLPNNLKLCRKTRKMTQEQAANELKVSRNQYKNWETGRSEPNISNILKIHRAFGVSVDFLIMNETDTMHHVPASPGMLYQRGKGFFRP